MSPVKIPSAKAKGLVVAMIPTYNEGQNIRQVVEEILGLRLRWDLRVLVVDDNSPDGTGKVVEDMARKDARVRLLLRTKRRGRGAAGIDGFREALRLGADYVIEMDGDLSHQPAYITQLLDACQIYDLVLGSRFVHGGKDANRPLFRRFITLLVRKFIRSRFGVPVRDASSGFRCFRREVLEAVDLDDLISVGPSVVLEVLYKAHLLGFSIGEIPITFVDREKGKTKLSFLTLVETLVMVIKFRKQYAGLRRIKPARA
jgi:dolichol-phosphate mannosyltransferase